MATSTNQQHLVYNHWKTYIGEQDFVKIKLMGLNLVRIPIGYWAFELMPGDVYLQGQEAYLDQALVWASRTGLQVQIDLHGLPGSQNGFDNLGRRGEVLWLQSENQHASMDVLEYVIEKYTAPGAKVHGVLVVPVVHSVEVVNEPFAAIMDVGELRQFYLDAYEAVRAISDVPIYFHDGFLAIGLWNDFMGDAFRVSLDHHLYEIFSDHQIGLDIDAHIANVYGQGWAMAQQPHPHIVGEFSGALTDCTKYINGVGNGARYDGTFGGGTGSCEGHANFTMWSSQLVQDTKRFLAAQFEVYEEHADGWIFWNYKTEGAYEWDYVWLWEHDMLPEWLRRRSHQPSWAYRKEKGEGEKKGEKSESESESEGESESESDGEGRRVFWDTEDDLDWGLEDDEEPLDSLQTKITVVPVNVLNGSEASSGSGSADFNDSAETNVPVISTDGSLILNSSVPLGNTPVDGGAVNGTKNGTGRITSGSGAIRASLLALALLFFMELAAFLYFME